MCGRMSLTTPIEAVSAYFNTSERPNLAPRYNIAPTQPVVTVRVRPGFEFDDGMRRNTNRRELTHTRWGLVPGWAKEISSQPLINARSETVLEKPSFKSAFRRRRCLVPVDCWYEWRRKDGSNQPYRFSLDGDDGSNGGEQRPFALGAIWEPWHSPDGSELESLALLTTDAAPGIDHIHHRMPVIIHPDHFDDWLFTREEDSPNLLPLCQPWQGKDIRAHAISPAVNKVSNDRPELWQEVEELRSAPPPAKAPAVKETDDPVQGSLF